MIDQNLSVKHVKEFCLDCSGYCRPYVIWCPCHGKGSAKCQLWPFRLGMQPATLRARYGGRLLTPEMMPDHRIELGKLPGTLEAAATSEIDISADKEMGSPAYYQPAVIIEKKPKQELTPEQRDALTQRLSRGRVRRTPLTLPMLEPTDP